MWSLRLEGERAVFPQTPFYNISLRKPLQSLHGFPLSPVAVTSFLMAQLLFASPSEITCGGDWNPPRCEERCLR